MEEHEQVELRVIENLLAGTKVGPASLSRTCAGLLVEAVGCLRTRKDHNDQVTSTYFVLIAHLFLEQIDRDEPPGPEIGALRSVMSDVRLDRLRVDDLLEEYFISTPRVSVPGKVKLDESQEARLGPGLLAVLNDLAGRGSIVTSDQLVGALFQDERTGVFRRMRSGPLKPDIALESAAVRIENTQPGAISEAPLAAGPETELEGDRAASDNQKRRPRRGQHARMIREAASEELGLGIDRYALALATILRTAEGEFNFALFGRWGSGKTTLTSLLRPLLENPAAYRAATLSPPNATYASRRYKTVVHNAWKYRNPPESWVFLYKSLASVAACSSGWYGRSMLALRAVIERCGFGGMFLALTLLAVSAIPLGLKLQAVIFVCSLLGFMSVIYLVAVTAGVNKKVKDLFLKNLVLVGREENLGMLALIGDDVRFLLSAWTASPKRARMHAHRLWKVGAPFLCVCTVSAIWAFGLAYSSHHGIFPHGAWTIDWHGLFAVDTASYGPYAHWTIWLVWTIAAFFMLVLPHFGLDERPDRILLIIDDLDRCTPIEMLGVIESVRLLLDDPVTNARMQVLMLVDETVLNHAIALRYESMIVERSASLAYAGETASRSATEEIIAEQTEKLFACYLRLPKLSREDVSELVRKLAGHENEVIRRRREVEAERERRKAEIAAESELKEKRLAADRAEERYARVREGVPRELHDIDAPSNRQPSVMRNMRMGGEPLPPMPHEKAARERANEPIREHNARIASQTPQQRLDERPDVVNERDQAKAAAEEAVRRLATMKRDAVAAAATAQPVELPFEQTDVRFSDKEVSILEEFAPGYFQKIRRLPSPRSIRALIFKIQLARLLLNLRNQDEEDHSLPKLLQAFDAAAEPGSEVPSESVAVAVARQVT